MKKMMKIGVVLMTVLMMAGSVWSYDMEEHVSQAPNGMGDVLIFPQYLAFPGGWNTRLTIINTCQTESVVAKLIVRSGGFTKELLDFFIFMSPADVWSGDINYGPNGPRIISYDDSVIRNINLDFADANNPFTADFQDVCATDVVNWGMAGDQVGYVEVIEAWNYGGSWTNSDGDNVNFGTPGVDKSDLMEAFFTTTGWSPFGSTQSVNTIGTFEETANVLAGHYEISYPAGNMYASNQATVLQNFNVNAPVTIGKETRMDGASSLNSLCEVEAALSKSRVALPYYAGNSGIATISWMTFPTKYTQVSNCAATDVLSDFFDQNAVSTTANPFTIEYGLKWYDMSENSPSSSNFTSPVSPEDEYFFPYEVNIVERILTISYNQGWANYEFSNADGVYTTLCDSDRDNIKDVLDDPTTTGVNEYAAYNEIEFYGAPAIPTTMFMAANRLDMMGGAWRDGWVYEDDTDAIEGTATASTYMPLYQVDWTAFGYYWKDVNGDGTLDPVEKGIFCEDLPVLTAPVVPRTLPPVPPATR